MSAIEIAPLGIAIFLLIIGLLMIIAPQVMRKLNKAMSRVIFTDSKFFMGKGMGGIIFIVLGIFLLSTHFSGMGIWGKFMWGGKSLEEALVIIGAISLVMGILFVIKPILLVRLSDLGNRVIFSDEKVDSHPRIFGAILLSAGFYIIYRMMPLI